MSESDSDPCGDSGGRACRERESGSLGWRGGGVGELMTRLEVERKGVCWMTEGLCNATQLRDLCSDIPAHFLLHIQVDNPAISCPAESDTFCSVFRDRGGKKKDRKVRDGDSFARDRLNAS